MRFVVEPWAGPRAATCSDRERAAHVADRWTWCDALQAITDPEQTAKRRIKRSEAKRAARQRKVAEYTRDKPRTIRRMGGPRSVKDDDDV